MHLGLEHKGSNSATPGTESTTPATGVIVYQPDQGAEGFPHNRFDRLRLPGLINDQIPLDLFTRECYTEPQIGGLFLEGPFQGLYMFSDI